MKKILIIKSSSMGDIIHALPVAHDIRQALPDARIDWVAEESFADIPPLAPAVEKVYVTAFRRWRKSPFSVKTRREVSALKAELQAEHYDIVIDIQGLIRSGLVARWTKAPTVGYTRQTIREPLAAFFYQRHLDLPEALGAVKRYRMAAAQALGYTIDPEHAVFGLKACGTAPLQTSGRTAAFAVNTSRDEKLWPEDHWMKLGCALAKEGISPVFYWGGAKEEARCRRIAAGIPGAAVAPKARLKGCGGWFGASAINDWGRYWANASGCRDGYPQCGDLRGDTDRYVAPDWRRPSGKLGRHQADSER